MKVLFMGTPDFAIPSLQALIDGPHSVEAVITQPDKPKGRGYQLMPPPVKERAEQYHLPVHQPSSLKNGVGLALFEQYKPDAVIVAAYGKILPKEMLEYPQYGCLNVHGSLLPKYRGAAPIQRSIMNGESVTGVTIMHMDEGLDTGDILLAKETNIAVNETAGDLFKRLSCMGAQALSEVLIRLESGSIQGIQQNHALATHASKITKDMCRIDFSKSAQEVHNFIRGLSSFPCAKTTLRGKLLKVYRTQICLGVSGVPGTVIDPKNFIVACGQEGIQLTEIQYEGSKKMSYKNFINGIKLRENENLT